jgi:hypothetical protein
VGVSATVESHYRFRGVDLTNGRADLKLGLSYDHESGAYGGAALIVGDRAGGGFAASGYTAYLGFARRTASGATWDIGATTTRIDADLPVDGTFYVQGVPYPQTRFLKYSATYTEAYVGAAKGPVSAHLYLSPDYLGEGLRTAYLDLNAAVRPIPRIRLFAHAGLLAPLGGRDGNWRRERLDVRTGVALELDHLEAAVAWTAVSRRVDYPAGYRQSRDAVVVSVSAFF